MSNLCDPCEYDFEFIGADEGKRVDIAIAERIEGISRARAQSLIREGLVILNDDLPPPKSYKVKAGDKVHVNAPAIEPIRIVPEDIDIDIVYEDDDIIVVDKYAGLVVHPAPGNEHGTLVNALVHHTMANGTGLSAIRGEIRPGIVHRIDKNTSGLLVVAKNNRAHAELSSRFARHDITRLYNVIAVGGFGEDEGSVDAPIGRDPNDRKKQKAISMPRGYEDDMPVGFRRAVTHWRVIERIGDFTLLECRLETGRTHQIRVHLSHIGRPVYGDDVYGSAKIAQANRKKGESQYLHAGMLGFVHPTSGEYMEFTSPLPEYFTRKLEGLRRKG